MAKQSDSSLPENPFEIDKANMHQAILDAPRLIEQGYSIAEPTDLSMLKGKYDSVLVSGMGGSSIAGLIMQSILADEKVRIAVSQDYYLPTWVDEKTLVLACSYSGNTEETLSAFKDARRKNCDIICLMTGGKLEKRAQPTRAPVVILPKDFQPRAAMFIQLFAMIKILEKLKLIRNMGEDVTRAREELKSKLLILENNAKELSEKLFTKTAIIYSSGRFGPVAYRWKCQINENAKVPAYYNVFPEMNHNEMQGYENYRGDNYAIFLKFEEDHVRTQKRMSLVKGIISKKGVPSTELGIKGRSTLSKIMLAIILGDLTSYYLALRLRTDPSPVNIVEQFKKDLGPFVD